jgi:hypothetical protein
MPDWPKVKAKMGLGKNTKPRQVINAIIRSKLVGGDDCLEAMELCDRLAKRLDRYPHQSQAANDTLDALRKLREIMADAAMRQAEEWSSEDAT